MISRFVQWQKKLSIAFNHRFMPEQMLVYGTNYFDTVLVEKYLRPGQVVYDVGGGKHPNISREIKDRYDLYIVGVDIDGDEINSAPKGLYDETVAADITEHRGQPRADLVLCRSVMEHVKDTAAALDGIVHLTRPGGIIVIFAPSRYAWFSIANRILPERVKVKLLDLAFPEKKNRLGFPAYYNNCTLPGFQAYAKDFNLDIMESKAFWQSRYFEILTPLHILWRFYQLIVRSLNSRRLCETFTIVYKKQESNG